MAARKARRRMERKGAPHTHFMCSVCACSVSAATAAAAATVVLLPTYSFPWSWQAHRLRLFTYHIWMNVCGCVLMYACVLMYSSPGGLHSCARLRGGVRVRHGPFILCHMYQSSRLKPMRRATIHHCRDTLRAENVTQRTGSSRLAKER